MTSPSKHVHHARKSGFKKYPKQGFLLRQKRHPKRGLRANFHTLNKDFRVSADLYTLSKDCNWFSYPKQSKPNFRFQFSAIFSGFSGKCKIQNDKILLFYSRFTFPYVPVIYIPFSRMSVANLTPFFLIFPVFDTLNAILAYRAYTWKIYPFSSFSFTRMVYMLQWQWPPRAVKLDFKHNTLELIANIWM